MYKGTLNDVLSKIAKQLDLDASKLIKYASEAPYAATRPDGNKWPSGTGSESEKRIVYAIAKSREPHIFLDIGTRWGAMTTQITSDDKRIVLSVDNERTIQGTKNQVGKFILSNVNVELIVSDIIEYLVKDTHFYELIFEDADHTYELTRAIYELAPKRLVESGIIISHDAVHPKFKGDIVKGIRASGIEPEVYLVEGDSCGLAIWQKQRAITETKSKPEIAIVDNMVNHPKADTEIQKETPKRRKRQRKKTSKITDKDIL